MIGNDGAVLSDITRIDIDYHREDDDIAPMKQIIIIGAFALCALSGPANAACYADYKAKKENPLKLHYGVIELPDTACDSTNSAAAAIAPRLAKAGWNLLNVLSLFDQSGLNERKPSAGAYFLRF